MQGAELPALAEATWPQVGASLRRVLLWPIGSTEQHGPHLPLATDTLVASALADAVRLRCPEVGLAPAQAIGASGEHEHFPGTLSIGTQVLTLVVIEFVRHASRYWEHVVVVNGHGGNLPALQAAQQRMAYEQRSLVVHHASGVGERADAHAGFLETSLLLHLHPELVHAEAAAPGVTAPLAEIWEALRDNGVRAVSGNGILGDPTGATAEAGRTAFGAMLAPLLATVRRLLSDAGPSPGRRDQNPGSTAV